MAKQTENRQDEEFRLLEPDGKRPEQVRGEMQSYGAATTGAGSQGNRNTEPPAPTQPLYTVGNFCFHNLHLPDAGVVRLVADEHLRPDPGNRDRTESDGPVQVGFFISAGPCNRGNVSGRLFCHGHGGHAPILWHHGIDNFLVRPLPWAGPKKGFE